MTTNEQNKLYEALNNLEGAHPAFADSVYDNAYCEAISDVKRIIAKMPIQEWSEEDEEMRNSIIDTIQDAMDECDVDSIGRTARAVYEKEYYWLKNIHPNHYKPSSHQMTALLSVLNEPDNAGTLFCHTTLGSLYDQLKQL